MSTRRKPSESSTLSRRRFVALVAAGSAALLTNPGAAAAAAAKKATRVAPGAKPAPSARTPEASAEIDKQRAATLETLKTIRAHALAAGAPPAFAFRPVKRAKGR